MKKYKVIKLLITAILSLTYLNACMFEEDVPDPIKFKYANTPVSKDNMSSYEGSYIVNNMDITSENNIYFPYFAGYVHIIKGDTNSLEYNYALKPVPLNNNEQTNFLLKTEYQTLGLSDIKDNYTLTLNNPIEIKDHNKTYKITSLRKQSDLVVVLDQNTKEESIVKTYKVCDPDLTDKDKNNCNSVDGAFLYIGYYKIENITCANQIYHIGTDFIGEMVATPSLKDLDVNVPITVKIQVINNSSLKTCLLTTEQQKNNNLYYTDFVYTLKPKDYSNSLTNAFSKVGLIGLKGEKTDIRTTQIDYYAKDNETFQPILFGDNNNEVTMRLKIIKQGT